MYNIVYAGAAASGRGGLSGTEGLGDYAADLDPFVVDQERLVGRLMAIRQQQLDFSRTRKDAVDRFGAAAAIEHLRADEFPGPRIVAFGAVDDDDIARIVAPALQAAGQQDLRKGVGAVLDQAGDDTRHQGRGAFFRFAIVRCFFLESAQVAGFGYARIGADLADGGQRERPAIVVVQEAGQRVIGKAGVLGEAARALALHLVQHP